MDTNLSEHEIEVLRVISVESGKLFELVVAEYLLLRASMVREHSRILEDS